MGIVRYERVLAQKYAKETAKKSLLSFTKERILSIFISDKYFLWNNINKQNKQFKIRIINIFIDLYCAIVCNLKINRQSKVKTVKKPITNN